jgi:hypothetical protein
LISRHQYLDFSTPASSINWLIISDKYENSLTIISILSVKEASNYPAPTDGAS